LMGFAGSAYRTRLMMASASICYSAPMIGSSRRRIREPSITAIERLFQKWKIGE
jgi:hypothetical protein